MAEDQVRFPRRITPPAISDFFQQQFERRVGHGRDRLSDSSQFWPDVGSMCGVIEADDAEIARDIEAAAVRDAYRSRRHVVIAGEDGGWLISFVQQFLCRRQP